MKIIITENQFKRLINENKEEEFINKVDKFIEPPYFYNLETTGVPKHLWEKILSKKFNQKVTIPENNKVHDSNGNMIYYEKSNGYWEKKKYDSNGNEIYYENSNGHWEKRKYDGDGRLIYIDNSNGWWEKT